MYFPRYTGDARPANSDTEQFLPEEEKVETILVVEDDADLRAYVSDVLRDLNYRVVSAASAQAALTLILQEEPKVDLLLTDVAREAGAADSTPSQDPVHDGILAERGGSSGQTR
jgi:CheY-like chemotaxis protein